MPPITWRQAANQFAILSADTEFELKDAGIARWQADVLALSNRETRSSNLARPLLTPEWPFSTPETFCYEELPSPLWFGAR
jgi:hypothetical protein